MVAMATVRGVTDTLMYQSNQFNRLPIGYHGTGLKSHNVSEKKSN